MKTAKITKVVSKKDFTNSYGTTIYHQLQMDNGDKIEIGKKKELKEGWELTYEITDDGFEYHKAKSVQPLPQTTATNTTTQSNPSGLNVQNLIVAQSSLSSAVEFCKNNALSEDRDVLDTADLFYKWVLTKG
jgi:hypothetical protein